MMPRSLRFLTVSLLFLIWPAVDVVRHRRHGFIRH